MTIADTEVGMSKQTLAKIFTPFCSTKGESGNGLGLWISREFAHRHGSTLRVKSSQQPGHIGSVFQLFLPLETELAFFMMSDCGLIVESRTQLTIRSFVL